MPGDDKLRSPNLWREDKVQLRTKYAFLDVRGFSLLALFFCCLRSFMLTGCRSINWNAEDYVIYRDIKSSSVDYP